MDAGIVKTTCPYCGVGCGIDVTRHDDGSVSVKGDVEHPANFGRLCSKGSALNETLSLDDRLLRPQIGNKPCNWDAALDLVAAKFSEAIASHGPDSVAFYVSGQILTEDYYVANKLMKGFIGSANIDTNSRLCMASSVAGHKRAFGSDTVPGVYEDIELADLVVLTGSNLAWCHPVLAQRLADARAKRGTKIIVIDPRATATSETSDLHLALSPGTDVALFNGLLAYLDEHAAINSEFVSTHTSGFQKALERARSMSLAEVALCTGLSRDQISEFFDLFASHERVVTVYSQGVNQSSNGTDKVNSIINCHLATGRIGKPGAGPFSVTGQPNAMGGREVGGLANMLAAHMELSSVDDRKLVQSFWNSPTIASKPGLKAVDMFRAVADGAVKAIWIMGTNPVVSAPEADLVRRALERCEFVVVSDVVGSTDTVLCADVLLPSLAWGEKSGTVTNSERRISRQRAFLSAPGESKPDWWQICEVARRMGFADSFAYGGVQDIFAEHAALSGFGNGGKRDFDISAWQEPDADRYERMRPFQWPQPSGSVEQHTRFFSDGGFFTPDRKAQFIAADFLPAASKTNTDFPLVLNTGRIRDQWHTMTRTAKTPRLMSHISEPFVEINPEDAHARGLQDADLALVKSERAEAVLRVKITEQQRRGSVFAPMHWTSEHASLARVDALVGGHVDPYSGQPELKFTPVNVSLIQPALHVFVVTMEKPECRDLLYWARARSKKGWRLECALAAGPSDWSHLLQCFLQAGEGIEVLAYHDTAREQYRFAAFSGNLLTGLLFASPKPVAAARAWAADCLGQEYVSSSTRLRLLAGRGQVNERDSGAIICSCFDVGINDIASAVRNQGCSSVATIGERLKAGTNCGSCRNEISRIIDINKLQKVS